MSERVIEHPVIPAEAGIQVGGKKRKLDSRVKPENDNIDSF
jgi:hypothetical protein